MFYYTLPFQIEINNYYGNTYKDLSFGVFLTASSTVPNSSYKYFSGTSFSMSFTVPSYVTAVSASGGNISVTKSGSTVTIKNVNALPTTSGQNVYLYATIRFTLSPSYTAPVTNTYSTTGSLSGTTVTFNRTYNTRGDLSISPNTLNFDDVKFGESVSQNVTVTITNAYNFGQYQTISHKYTYSAINIASYTITNGTKSGAFTYNNISYATYTCVFPVIFTGKFYDTQTIKTAISCWPWNYYTREATLTITANVTGDDNNSSTGSNDSGKIYLGNKLLSGFGDNLPVGTILMYYGSKNSIPSNWAICDGTNGTPNLTGRLPIGASSTLPVGTTGGSRYIYDGVTLSQSNIPAHTHTYSMPKIYKGRSDNANDRDVARWNNDVEALGSYTTSSWGQSSPSPISAPYYITLYFIMKISI